MTGFFSDNAAPIIQPRPRKAKPATLPMAPSPDARFIMERCYSIASTHATFFWAHYLTEAADVIRSLLPPE